MDYDELVERLGKLDTAGLCDAEKALGLGLRVVDPAIRPIPTGLKMVGRAHTVQCHNDFLAVVRGLDEAAAGEVLVIDSQGSERAVSGGLFPTEALRKGLAGIVNDGPCRDTAAVRTLGFPYYARSVNCQAGSTFHPGATQVPISCGGVPVEPGDVLVGDDDGIVVGTAALLAELVPLAEQIRATEGGLVEQMAAGQSLTRMMNLEEHLQALADDRPSTLQFRVPPPGQTR